jgi:cell wall-associated NlpC family hydrolase
MDMEFPARHAITLLILYGLASHPSAARGQKHPAGENASGDEGQAASHTLTVDDGLAVIAAALDSRVHLRAKRDCSHLVHAIYDRAGFPYSYVDSSDLYVGTPNFQRVSHPQPGDLVVWRGHVGIVINPSQHVFFSAMRSGPGIDSYDSPDWKRRGQVRFYRYIKGSGAQNASKARDRVLLTHQGK